MNRNQAIAQIVALTLENMRLFSMNVLRAMDETGDPEVQQKIQAGHREIVDGLRPAAAVEVPAPSDNSDVQKKKEGPVFKVEVDNPPALATVPADEPDSSQDEPETQEGPTVFDAAAKQFPAYDPDWFADNLDTARAMCRELLSLRLASIGTEETKAEINRITSKPRVTAFAATDCEKYYNEVTKAILNG